MIDFENYERLTKKEFRYENFYITDNSSRRVKDFSEFASMYNRFAELEDKIKKGLLVSRYSVQEDWQYGWWCLCEVDESSLILAQYKTEEEAKQKLKELTECDTE